MCGCYERVRACAVRSGSDLFSKINPVLILGVLVEHHVAKMEQCKQWRPHPQLCFLAESNFVQCGLQRPSQTRSLSRPWYADSRCWRLEAKMPASWPSARHRSRTSHPCHQGIQSCLPSRPPRPRPWLLSRQARSRAAQTHEPSCGSGTCIPTVQHRRQAVALKSSPACLS